VIAGRQLIFGPNPPTNVYINWIRKERGGGGTTLMILFQALILKIAK